MKLILSESQYINLLKEEKEEEISQTFSNSKDIAKKIVKDVKKQHGIDFTFALTWGSVIGGFVGPVYRYMEGTYTNLTEDEISLICFGIILTFFSDNKEKLKKVLELIKEKKLVTFFDRALLKSYDLRDALFGFLESLNMTFSKVSNMLAYTFLVPLVPLVKNLADMDLSTEQMELVVMGITHYTGGIISSKIISELLEKMIKRFRS
jgi:hypothetical protein